VNWTHYWVDWILSALRCYGIYDAAKSPMRKENTLALQTFVLSKCVKMFSIDVRILFALTNIGTTRID